MNENGVNSLTPFYSRSSNSGKRDGLLLVIMARDIELGALKVHPFISFRVVNCIFREYRSRGQKGCVKSFSTMAKRNRMKRMLEQTNY